MNFRRNTDCDAYKHTAGQMKSNNVVWNVLRVYKSQSAQKHPYNIKYT